MTVQTEPVPNSYPFVPLPTEYWTRPINSQLYAWYSIGGNWLTPWSTNPNQNFYVTGNDQSPRSAHVLWTKPLSAGGLVGAPLNNSGYDVGEAYEYQFAGTIVMNGILYYNLFPSTYANAQKILVAVDIRTGQEALETIRCYCYTRSTIRLQCRKSARIFCSHMGNEWINMVSI